MIRAGFYREEGEAAVYYVDGLTRRLIRSPQHLMDEVNQRYGQTLTDPGRAYEWVAVVPAGAIGRGLAANWLVLVALAAAALAVVRRLRR